MVTTVVDAATGIPSMIHDVQTIANGKASVVDKLLAAGDLALNVVLDVSMIVGIGEAARAAYFGIRLGIDLAAHIGEDAAAHALDDVASHAADDAVGAAVNGACSFSAATTVALASGTQAIGTLKVGQKVLAYNPKTHKMEAEPIVQVWKHTDDDLVDLTLTVQMHAPHSAVTHRKSEVVHTNKKHPFLTVEHGFLNVASVKVGMHIERADGTVGTVTKWQIVPGIQMMYNLEVAQDHTFTVGVGQWIVHNCAVGPTPSAGTTGSYRQLVSQAKGTGLQAHHIFQDAMMKYLPGYIRKDAPAILLNAADHGVATSAQRAAGTAFRSAGLTSLTFEQGQRVAEESLRAAGYSGTQLSQIVGDAANWFTSNWSSSALDALNVPDR